MYGIITIGNAAMRASQSRNWLYIDIVIILLFLISVILGHIYIHHFLLEPVFFIAIGLMFLTSKMLRAKLCTSKLFFWIADNILKPRTKINHIIYGIFSIVLSLIPITNHINDESIELYKNLGKSLEFWIIIAAVVLFNMLVGLYTYTQRKKKKEEQSKTKGTP